MWKRLYRNKRRETLFSSLLKLWILSYKSCPYCLKDETSRIFQTKKPCDQCTPLSTWVLYNISEAHWANPCNQVISPNNYLMHLAYATSLSQHVSHAKLICEVHILWEGECLICLLQKIPSRWQHSTSTCLISTPHSQTLLTMHKEFQMQFDFRHEYIWHIECLVF